MRPTPARRAALLPLVPLLAGSLAAGTLVTPSPAHAQRGLMGAIKRRAAEEAVGRVLSGRPAAAAPTFDDRVLEITGDRVDQLLVGLRVEAEQAAAGRRASAADAQRARAARAGDSTYSACVRSFEARNMEALAAVAAAARSGTPNALSAAKARQVRLGAEQEARCGPASEDSAFASMAEPSGASTDPLDVAARRAGLTGSQYRVLRERLIAFLQVRGHDTARYVFTAAERAALERRAADLEPFRALLEGQA
jgi:hypothetical protein